MPKIVRREGEDLENLLRRFRRSVNDANILGECRKREYFISNGEKKREKQRKRIVEIRKAAAIQRRLDNRTFTRQYDYVPGNSNVGKNFSKNSENRFKKEQPVKTETAAPKVANPAPQQNTQKQVANTKPAYYSYRRQPKQAPKTEE